MKSHYPKPQVGMEVFVVYRMTQTIKVITNVGNKWVYFGDESLIRRFDKETWKIDNGRYASPGDVYPSEQYYNEECELNNAWDELITSIRCIRMPKDMTVEKIKEIRKIMGIDQ